MLIKVTTAIAYAGSRSFGSHSSQKGRFLREPLHTKPGFFGFLFAMRSDSFIKNSMLVLVAEQSYSRSMEAPLHLNPGKTSELAYLIREGATASSLSKAALYCDIASRRLRAIRCGGRTMIPADTLVASFKRAGLRHGPEIQRPRRGSPTGSLAFNAVAV